MTVSANHLKPPYPGSRGAPVRRPAGSQSGGGCPERDGLGSDEFTCRYGVDDTQPAGRTGRVRCGRQ